MAAEVQATVVIPASSGLPGDSMTNTFWFAGAGATYGTPLLEELRDMLSTFYTTALALGVGTYYVWSGATVEFRNWMESPPRVPEILDAELDAVVTTGSPYPQECAVVLSFQAVPVSGIPQARRRGRIYLGSPTTAWATISSGAVRVHQDALDDITTAAQQLKTSAVFEGCPWCVYSRTNNAFYEVADGWVENAFDTQRRRGISATSRELWGP